MKITFIKKQNRKNALVWSKVVVFGIIKATKGGGTNAGCTRVYRVFDEAKSNAVRAKQHFN